MRAEEMGRLCGQALGGALVLAVFWVLFKLVKMAFKKAPTDAKDST
jgi:hypothetical protein